MSNNDLTQTVRYACRIDLAASAVAIRIRATIRRFVLRTRTVDVFTLPGLVFYTRVDAVRNNRKIEKPAGQMTLFIPTQSLDNL